MLFDKAIKRGLIAVAGMLTDDLAVLKGDNGRDTADTKFGGYTGGFVAVVLDNAGATVKGHGCLFKTRGEHTAGAAPGSPKIDENRQIGVQNSGLEVVVVDVKDFAHDISI